MFIGYARTSTVDQEAGLEAQHRDLKAAGAAKIFSEQASSVGKRDQFDLAMDFVREGDTLVVSRLDRLARSVADLGKILETLEAKKASLKILNLGGSSVDTSSPTGRLLLNLLGSISEFERSIMLERQREGIAKAREKGVYKGRKPTARAKADRIKAMKADGIGASKIAAELGIGRASVYRVLREAGHTVQSERQ